MKTESRTVTKTVAEKVYIASDGEEFTNSYACEEHEAEIAVKEAIKKIEYAHTLTGCMAFDGEDRSSCNAHYWFKPKSGEEIDILNRFNTGGGELDERYIGKWVNIEKSVDGCAWYTSLDEMLRYVKSVCEVLGYEVEIKKKGNENA